MEFCIICLNYKNAHKQVHTFVDNLVAKLSDNNIVCNVIAPQSLFSFLFKKKNRRKYKQAYETKRGITYNVFSPLFFVFPNIKMRHFSFADLSRFSFYMSLKRLYRREKMNPDVIYSHFFLAGVSGTMLAKRFKKISIIANGEADTIDSLKFLSQKAIDRVLADVDGIICVSSKNRDEVNTLCGGSPEIMKKTTIIPNAFDDCKFFPKDKGKCRKDLGFPEDAFIVSFTGSFIERKGVQVLSNAIDSLSGVYSIFVGTGPLKPSCKGILFEGKVENSKLVDYLCSSDVFVLPTLAEGCSNAIVEAIGCGVPVISSDRSFNYDILDSSCSILINPENEDEIAKAIELLKNDLDLRDKLKKGCAEKSKILSLDNRARRIERFANDLLCGKNICD